MADDLVIYFSRAGQNYLDGRIVELKKGNTKLCAETIAKSVSGDLFEVESVQAYPEDYQLCTKVAKDELIKQARPEIKRYLSDLSKYQRIFVCGPCWWGTFPMPLFTLLEKLDVSGKKIMVLVTHEGSGLGSCANYVMHACKGAELIDTLAVRGGDCVLSQDLVATWALKKF